MIKNLNNKICIALDFDSKDQAMLVVNQIKDYVQFYKVGMQLFTTEGPDIIQEIVDSGCKVFLDLKYHDIPNTVAQAAKACVSHGVYMFNVHASGGFEMLLAASEACKEESYKLGIEKPIVLGVTVLTSINSEILNNEIIVSNSIMDYVIHLARLSQKAGLDGIVSSPLEIKYVRQACDPNFKIVTPGVRPLWSVNTKDQKRIAEPKMAFEAGADYIVIGRPITKAKDPVWAIKKLISDIKD